MDGTGPVFVLSLKKDLSDVTAKHKIGEIDAEEKREEPSTVRYEPGKMEKAPDHGSKDDLLQIVLLQQPPGQNVSS